MKIFMSHRFLILFLTFTLSITICDAQDLRSGSLKRFEQKIFGKSVNNKNSPKVRESKKVVRAKKEQAKSEKKLKKEYADYIKASQKRSMEIQTPEVQERMKQNNKETIKINKERKKAVKEASKKAGKRYN